MALSKPTRQEKVAQLLSRGVDSVVDPRHLRSSLESGKKLRVKLGIDPTGTTIHIGRAVLLWKLRGFQDLGHKIVLIIGDFTAQIGDPSDKLSKRPFLSREDVKANLKHYLKQIGAIIDLKKAEVRYNSEWLGKLDFQEIAQIAEIFSIQQMIERRNFKERWEKHEEISLREFMYPLMQGYDSVAVKADVELGGSDQLFNLFAGRKIQEHFGQKPQDIMTLHMLPGLDGRKMSTTWGNVINTTDSPEEQYGKVMSMHDSQIIGYFTLATDVPIEHIRAYDAELKNGINPKTLKEKLAGKIVRRYHGAEAAAQAAEQFQQLFSKKQIPTNIPVLHLGDSKGRTGHHASPVDIVIASAVVKSRSDAWRLVEQGGFEIDGVVKKLPREDIVLKGGEVVKVGKRHFFRVKV